MTKRLHQWQSALQYLIAERRLMPFEWGRNDCGLFAADCVQAITGEDPAPGFRGVYASESGAQAVLDANGGLEGVAAASFGAEIAPALAQVGDVVLCKIQGRDMLAICAGSHAIGPGHNRLASMPMKRAQKAWRCTKD